MSEDQTEGPTGTPEWRVPADEQLKADAYHVWKPRPLLRSIFWKPVPEPEKDAATGSYEVFLDQRAFRSMHQHLWNADPTESPFGFLIGDLCEDPDSGRRYVIVSAAVPSRFQLQEGPESMPRESLVALELEADRRKGVLAGWYRRQPTGPVELTASDMKMHEMHFPHPWQVAFLFVTDHASPSGGCFRRALRGLKGDAPLPFHEMVSNESLLARGVRRSRLDWTNVETTDSVEPDPPPRPEPPPEPERPETDTDEEGVPEPAGAEPSTGEAAGDAVPPVIAAEGELAGLPEPEELEELEEPEETKEIEEAEDVSAAPPGDGAPGARIDHAPPPEPESPGEDDFDFPLLDEEEIGGPDSREPDEEALEELAAVESDEPASEPEVPGVDLLPYEPHLGPEGAEGEAELPEPLPEPGWDEDDLGAPAATPSLDEVDLESFVVEVEGADVAGQVGQVPDVEEIEPGWDEPAPDEEMEPGWDEPASDEELESEDDLALPIVPDLESATEPPVPIEIDEAADGDEEAEPVDAAEVASAPEAAEVPPGEAVSPPAESRTPLLRRPVVAVTVLLIVAVVATVLVLGRPIGSESGPGVTTPGAVSPGGGIEAQDAPTPQPESGDGGEGGEQASGAATDTAPPPTTAADIERLGDSLLEAISRYYGLAVALDEGEATCAELQTAYVEVENGWIAYNVEGRARFRGRLPEELEVRDERLYSGVQDVEREFNRSVCERP